MGQMGFGQPQIERSTVGKIIFNPEGKSMATLYLATVRLSRDFGQIFDPLLAGIE